MYNKIRNDMLKNRLWSTEHKSMLRFIRIPFQFKVYLLFLALFLLLMQLVTTHIKSVVTDQILKKESVQFEDFKSLFHNLIEAKTESLRNEALLVAGQFDVRETLELLNQGQMMESFLRMYYPSNHPHSFLVFTDSKGNVIDGFITISENDEEIWIDQTSDLQKIAGDRPFGVLQSNQPLESYVTIQHKNRFRLFAVSTVPVYEFGLNPKVSGTVTLGFAVDNTLAVSLQKNSPFEIGFVADGTPLTSSLSGLQNNIFRRIWFASIENGRSSLLIEPKIMSVDDRLYMAYASYLHHNNGNEKVAYILFSPMDDTMDLFRYLDQSVLWFSILVFCGMLIIGYLLSRGVTAPVRRLASTVSLLSEGRYDVDAKVRSGDELQTLSEVIQQLATKLQMREEEAKKYVQQIEEWNRELETKVAERTKELEAKNSSLEATSNELEEAYNQMDEELKIVGDLQQKLLPHEGLEMDGLRIQSFYSPNGRAGGDYYDFIQTGPNTIYILIADVAGHGTPAAFIMGITRTIAHSLIEKRESPKSILYELSEQLVDTTRRGEFVTLFLGRFDLETNQLTYSLAGHPPPMLYRQESNVIEELSVDKGLPLGIIDTPEYEECTITISVGDRLLMYTDGIVECFNPARECYGEERLKEQLANNFHKPAKQFLQDVIHDLTRHVEHPLDIEPLEDDVTLVCMDFTPQAASLLSSNP